MIRRGIPLWTAALISLMPATTLLAQADDEPAPQPYPVQVTLTDDADLNGGQFAYLQGLAPPEGVALNMPYATITSPIQVIVVNEAPGSSIAVEIIDSTGGVSAPGIITQVPEGAVATFRVEGEYTVRINAIGDDPVPYTFLVWVMPATPQMPDSIYMNGGQ